MSGNKLIKETIIDVFLFAIISVSVSFLMVDYEWIVKVIVSAAIFFIILCVSKIRGK